MNLNLLHNSTDNYHLFQIFYKYCFSWFYFITTKNINILFSIIVYEIYLKASFIFKFLLNRQKSLFAKDTVTVLINSVGAPQTPMFLPLLQEIELLDSGMQELVNQLQQFLQKVSIYLLSIELVSKSMFIRLNNPRWKHQHQLATKWKVHCSGE